MWILMCGLRLNMIAAELALRRKVLSILVAITI